MPVLTTVLRWLRELDPWLQVASAIGAVGLAWKPLTWAWRLARWAWSKMKPLPDGVSPVAAKRENLENRRAPSGSPTVREFAQVMQADDGTLAKLRAGTRGYIQSAAPTAQLCRHCGSWLTDGYCRTCAQRKADIERATEKAMREADFDPEPPYQGYRPDSRPTCVSCRRSSPSRIPRHLTGWRCERCGAANHA